MKRALSLMLALILVLLSTAALASDLSAYSQTIVIDEEYPVFWQEDLEFPLVDEPITIKVMLRRNANHPEDFSDMWYVNYIEELTNIRFEFELIEQAAWVERKNLAFISDDYPDVFFANISTTDELLYSAEGKLIDLLPLIKENAPNIMALYEAFPDVVKGTLHDNGAIYMLPMISFAPRSAVPHCTLVNEQWLEAVNLEIPTNTDELYTVLKAFKEQDPNGNGEADEIPVSLMDDANEFILYAFGFTDHNHDIIDGQYVYVPAQDNYRAYLEYMNRLYTEGLLDNDYFTQDATERNAKLAASLVGMPQQSMTASVPDYEKYIAVPALTSPVNDTPMWPETSIHYQSNVASLVITDKCQYPEAVIKFANYLTTTEGALAARLGPSQEQSGDGYGYTYEYTDGKHAYGATRSFPDTFTSYSQYRYSKTVMFLPAYINPLVDDVVVGSDDKNNHQTKVWAESGIYDVRRTAYALQNVHTDEEVSDLVYYVDLDNYVAQTRAKFINGDLELNDANWAAFLKQMEGYGLSDMITLRQTGYERYLSLPDSVN